MTGGPAPTLAPGDKLADYAYTDIPPISTTTLDGSILPGSGASGLGSLPEGPAASSGVPAIPSPQVPGAGVDAVAERAMISVGSIGKSLPLLFTLIRN